MPPPPPSSPLPPRSAEHSSLLEPSPTGDPWKAWCLDCNTDVGTRRQDMVKGWHISKGAIAAKSSRNLALWSSFRLTRECFPLLTVTRFSLRVKKQKVRSTRGVESDKTQFYSSPPPLHPSSSSPPKALQLPRPPPHHCRRCRPAAEEGVVERRRWRQDILASEGRLMARLDETRSEFCQVAQSLNEVLREGLGSAIEASYRGRC